MEKQRHWEGQPKATACRAGTGTPDSDTLATPPTLQIAGEGHRRVPSWSAKERNKATRGRPLWKAQSLTRRPVFCTAPGRALHKTHQQGANSHPGHCYQTARPRGPLHHCAPEPHTAPMRAQTPPEKTKPRILQNPEQESEPQGPAPGWCIHR